MSNDAHSRPSGETEELLYDPDVPTPTHGERARTLVAAIKTGTLCTIAKEPEGYPYGSFVTFAMDGGSPVFFISDLAEHTKNLKRDGRASLLVAEGGEDDPLANGRVTLLGPCRRLGDGEERERAKAAYLEAHPNASYYISGFRPNHLELDHPQGDPLEFATTLAVTEITGSETFVHLDHHGDRWVGLVHGVRNLEIGAHLPVYLDPKHVYIFAKETGTLVAPASYASAA